MSMASGEPGYIEAELNYLRPGGPRPVNYTYPAPPGVLQQSGELEPRKARIHDARRLERAASLDRHGFELRTHRSALREFSDEAKIRAVYYPEAEALLRAATGAEKVVIFDHTLRDSAAARAEGVREPVRRVHNDQTFVSGPRRVRDHLSAGEAEQRLRRRFAILNLWRPIGAPVQRWPLALCDARSIHPQDLVPTDLVYPDKVGEVYSFTASDAHRWFYFPELAPDEVLLLKIYDSRTDGTARLTAHTAFEDPTSPADAPPRRSIELRTLVFFPD
jgi:hypothetical protein